jgi:macrodomain Ter protein organizer (MatP/YcbG family)
MKKHKQIRDMDDNVWNIFVGYCKTQGKNVSDVLTDMIQKVTGKKTKNEEDKK